MEYNCPENHLFGLALTDFAKKNHDMHNIYAVILFQLKKYDDAIFEWEKAISLKPNYHFGYNNLGNAFLLKNDLNQALKNYNKAIEINPKYYEAIYNKANIFLKLIETLLGFPEKADWAILLILKS